MVEVALERVVDGVFVAGVDEGHARGGVLGLLDGAQDGEGVLHGEVVAAVAQHAHCGVVAILAVVAPALGRQVRGQVEQREVAVDGEAVLDDDVAAAGLGDQEAALRVGEQRVVGVAGQVEDVMGVQRGDHLVEGALARLIFLHQLAELQRVGVRAEQAALALHHVQHHREVAVRIDALCPAFRRGELMKEGHELLKER